MVVSEDEAGTVVFEETEFTLQDPAVIDGRDFDWKQEPPVIVLIEVKPGTNVAQVARVLDRLPLAKIEQIGFVGRIDVADEVDVPEAEPGR